MKKLTHYLFVFIFLLGNSFILAQTNGMDSSGTLKANETYPELFMKKVGFKPEYWIVWPNGEKEMVKRFYFDIKDSIEDDSFYVILTNNVEQIVVIKDDEFWSNYRENRELLKRSLEKTDERHQLRLKARERKRLIRCGIVVVAFLTPLFGIWYFGARRKEPQKQQEENSNHDGSNP